MNEQHHTRIEQADFGRRLLTAATAYALFVIYGSLVPFAFEPIPFAEALRRFSEIPFLDLGIGQRADWVANFLLFIPLSLLLYGGLVCRWPRGARVWLLAVFGFGLALGAGIEFTQIYFPGRTVSLNDLYAQCLGSAVGLASWRAARAHLWRAYHAWRAPARGHEKLHLFLWLYLAAFLFYSVLPLDLTISIAEIHEKWKSGRVRLNLFRIGSGTPVEIVYELATDVLVWVPVAALAMLHFRGQVARSILAVFLVALALECAQLLVFTRVADSRDVLAAMVGGTAACLALRRLGLFAQAPQSHHETAPSAGGRVPVRWLGVLLVFWLSILAVVFWYPFEFTTEPAIVAQRWEQMFRVPLSAYYYGSEYRAVTELLRKLLMFLPLGALLTMLGASLRVVALIGLGTALGIEVGQVLLPTKTVDPGDLLVCTLGAIAGHLVVVHLLSVRHVPSNDMRVQEGLELGSSRRKRMGLAVAVYVLFAVAGAIAAGSLSALRALPYNVREVVLGDASGVAGAMLIAAAILLTAPAVLLAGWLRDGAARWRVPGLLAGLAALGLLAWWCLHIGVPRESVHDIVGSPVLDWPWHWEVAGRFVALQLPLAVMGVLAACLTLILLGDGRRAIRALRRCLVAAFLALLLAHEIVVRQAATDNLTELMRGGGSVAGSAALAAWLLLSLLAAHAVAATLAVRRRAPLVGALIALAGLALGGRALLDLGLVAALDKYGQTFSALQFLLSPSREQLLDGPALAARVAWLQGGFVLAIAALVLPVWVAMTSGHASRTGRRARTVAAGTRSRRPTGADDPEPASEASGSYVRMLMTADDEALFRSQLSAAGLMASDYLAGLAGNSDNAMREVRHGSGAGQGARARAVDIWLDAAALARIDALAAAGGGSREESIRALLAIGAASHER